MVFWPLLRLCCNVMSKYIFLMSCLKRFRSIFQKIPFILPLYGNILQANFFDLKNSKNCQINGKLEPLKGCEITFFGSYHPLIYFNQGCEWNDKSANRERESRTRIGSDATFFWDSLSNLVIDDNFRISNNLGLGLAANISTALAIQPDRDREIEII